ncbi:hypothetical protein SARC_06065 [Sphaeroforma arctica JP610]|uniref:Presequence protease, mitochondrial n=1 Tax=Sphaeroforma arctica JP610 TaxID=667725 RepID=A0A0L0FXT8_9EUKA|nr:hypothetical protein SARC_06065 [Sphaeroforma arctica JP610]KNC81627.1 hypothetical protein SARC_06065 [Sphaeroforma arctica JP610]|eukprot:XP_014155529.1 hypothetical protein SARC_06065 [Sphaeroforma arctica JP610]
MWRTIHTVQQSAVRSSLLLRRWASSNTAAAQNTTAHARISHHSDVGVKVGETVNGFTIKGIESIPELSLTAVQHVHDKTGAVGLHIARADDNNVFSIGFRTPPEDSSGVTHVLEHVSLCGSEKYPCRDPFFKMLSRSMATYMNAWTASDYTMYPFSTQNANDYNNLLDVYLDAVLHPSIRELDFLQEGWRLENENPNDKSTDLQFKGVVFNEMKGALSDPDRLFCTRFQQALFPGSTYGNVSGGDPPSILSKLDVNVLREFHRTHYHPSNARVYTYGDLPLTRHFESIGPLFDSFDKLVADTEVGPVPRWTEPCEVIAHCPPDTMAAHADRQTKASIGWLLQKEDAYEGFCQRILTSLLVDGSSSPMYIALIESQLGSDYTPNTGLDTSTREPSFSVGLQGIKESDIPMVKDMIEKTIQKTMEDGFEAERVEAVLHQIELSQRDQTTSFGLGLAAALMGPWVNDCDPVELLQIQAHVERFRTDMADPYFVKNFFERHLISNQHRLTFIMTPDEKFTNNLAQQEADYLKEVVSTLSDESRDRVYEQGLQLLKEQETTPDLSCLPTLRVEDIERKIHQVAREKRSLSTSKGASVDTQFCEQPTNQMTYMRTIFNTQNVPAHLKPYIPLFCSVLPSLGAGSRDYRELGQKTKLWTGGIRLSPLLVQDRNDTSKHSEGIMLLARCLDRNLEHTTSLCSDILNESHFDGTEQRLYTLVKMAYSDMANSVSDAGHHFAITRAAASLTQYDAMTEVYGGLTQIDFMRKLAEQQDQQEILSKLRELASHVFMTSNARCAINADSIGMRAAETQLERLLNTLPSDRPTQSGSNESSGEYSLPSFNQEKLYVPLPVNVNFVAKSVASIPSNHEDSATLQVLTSLLSAKFLHREVREKNGAYGGGLSAGSGSLSYYSYRDPGFEATLKAYNEAPQYLLSGDYSESDVEEAKLTVFQRMDKPVSPGSKGMSGFVYGVSNEARQRHRDRLFAVDREALVQATNKYLVNRQDEKTVIIGPGEDAQTFEKMDGWSIKA